MPSGASKALAVALEQRQRVLDQTRQVLSACDRAVTEHLALVDAAESRVNMVVHQMDSAQRPSPGEQLPVADLRGLEYLLDWCEAHLAVANERLDAARAEADQSRGYVAVAHQQVRALELVLEARAAEAAEKVRRGELRDADETAARVHARNMVLAR